jgi:hypothetical protein
MAAKKCHIPGMINTPESRENLKTLYEEMAKLHEEAATMVRSNPLPLQQPRITQLKSLQNRISALARKIELVPGWP